MTSDFILKTICFFNKSNSNNHLFVLIQKYINNSRVYHIVMDKNKYDIRVYTYQHNRFIKLFYLSHFQSAKSLAD